jgi:hypothetical protein
MIGEQLKRQERFFVVAYVSPRAFTLTSHYTAALILSDLATPTLSSNPFPSTFY